MQDILEDKITYPLFYALKSSSKKDSSKILKKLKNKDFSKEEEVAGFVSSSSAFNKCNSLIQSYSTEISKCINKISNKEIRYEMLNLSESLKNRYE